MRTKENYGGLDGFRLAAAFLVIAIHTSPLASLNADADFFLTRILARAAVPFFFMVTGHFVAGGFLKRRESADLCPPQFNIADSEGPGHHAWKDAPWRYLRKLLLLYLCGILLYLPVGVYAGHYEGLTLPGVLKMFFFDGTFYHLWYFPACITGVLTVYLMSSFLGPRGMLAISAALYLTGLMGDSYFGLAQRLPVLEAVYRFLFSFSSYTRNGLFFAPLFLVLGARLGQSGRLEKIRAFGLRNLAGLAVSLLLMTGEAFCLRYFELPRHDSMYLMLVPTAVFLYRSLLCLSGSSRRLFRSAALWIYILHPAFIVAVRGAARGWGLTALLVDNSLVHYLAVGALSAGAGFAMAYAGQKYYEYSAAGGRERRREAPTAGTQGLRRAQGRAETGRAWLELDREALAANVSYLQSLLPASCRLMPAVKANAYGHGAALIAGELNRLGVRSFCVACIAEGIALRREKVKGEILILGYTAPEDMPLLARYRLTQAVVDYPYAELLARSALKLHVHIAVDTGMHRLGIRCEDMEDILAVFEMKNLIIDGMFTHLSACEAVDGESRAFTESQISAFYDVAGSLEQQGCPCPKLHLQSSYGILNYPGLDADYVRPGIALYGVHSTAESRLRFPKKLAPVLSMRARVISVRTLYAGDSAGYGLAFTAEEPMKAAVLSIGYADGLPRMLSCGGGYVLLHGRKAPVIGRVCMDQTLVDVSGIPQTQPGDIAVLIGKSGELEITAEEVAGQCGTITNELLSRLGSRLDRFFCNSSASQC